MAMHIANSSGGWSTVKGISSFNGTSWVTAANAAILDGGSWVGFLDKVALTSGSAGSGSLARYQINDDGSGRVDGGEWCQNPNNTDLYEVEATWEWISQNGLLEPTGTFNSWVPLGVGLVRWQISTSPARPGPGSGTLGLIIRNKLTLQELTSATITMSALYDPFNPPEPD